MPRPRKQLLICLIGADGSGKTTLGNRLVDELAGQASCVWLGAESIIMRPVRAVLQMILRRGAGRRGRHANSAVEASRKQSLARRFRWLRAPYTALVVFDYWLQYRFKRARYQHAQVLILDRYLFDVAVNLAITLGWSEDELIDFLQRHFHRFSLPRVRCLLRVDPEISIQRKNDIPDAKYIEMRVRFYERIARDFGFSVLEASNSVDHNLARLTEIIEAQLRSTHVHYVHSNNRDVGGADFCLVRVAKEVRDQGFTVTASLRIRTPIFEWYADSGVPVMRYPFCRPQFSRGMRGLALLPFTAPWTILYFLRLFRSLAPDIVHVNDLYDFLPAFAARMAGIPVVYHIRMIRERALERRMFGRLLSTLAVASVSVSEAVRGAYFAEPFPARHRAEVIYDWPDDRLVVPDRGPCPDAYSNHATRVIMVGRLESWKGQHVFVDAVKRFHGRGRSDGIGFYLAGGMVLGEEKRRYGKAVVSSAQSAGIVYLGERRDVRNLLQWADLSVHASTAADPFPGVVLESLLAGTATIASAAGGVGEMIESGSNGILVTPGDAAALADAIERLLNDPELNARLAENGRKTILKQFVKAELLQQLLALYSKVQVPTERARH